MPISVENLPGQDAFGAVVTGLTKGDIDDPAVIDRLRALWIDRGVIVFRGTDGTAETHIALSEKFGDLLVHPLAPKDVPNPSLATIRYDAGKGDLYTVDGENRGGWQPWHFDLAYVDYINRGGILRPLTMPSRAGETGFICQIAAYETLDPELAAAIEGKSVLYRFDIDSSNMRFGNRPDACVRISDNHRKSMDRFAGRPRSIHPLVYEQRETGRKVLNVSAWFAEGIEGMENPEGDALLRRAIDHLCNPSLAYFHKWEMDDMVLWDNWRMLHCACGSPEHEDRLMERTTIAGDYGYGRLEGLTSVPEEMQAVKA